MPSRYVIRTFGPNCIYHVFNRGVEKRDIFKDKQDFQLFKYYLFIYCNPAKKVLIKYPKLPLRLHSKNLHGEVKLLAYCLMPNHFHLLLKQISQDAISKLIKQLTNAYTEYFNKKYQRTGSLMEGRFKAVLVNSEELLMHASRYIHLNPVVSNLVNNPKDYPWGSYLEYLGVSKENLCEKEVVLDLFSSREDYDKFVNDQIDYGRELEKIKHLTIDQ